MQKRSNYMKTPANSTRDFINVNIKALVFLNISISSSSLSCQRKIRAMPTHQGLVPETQSPHSGQARSKCHVVKSYHGPFYSNN